MHQNDIVPQLPPQKGLALFDFHHPPTEGLGFSLGFVHIVRKYEVKFKTSMLRRFVQLCVDVAGTSYSVFM